MARSEKYQVLVDGTRKAAGKPQLKRCLPSQGITLPALGRELERLSPAALLTLRRALPFHELRAGSAVSDEAVRAQLYLAEALHHYTLPQGFKPPGE